MTTDDFLKSHLMIGHVTCEPVVKPANVCPACARPITLQPSGWWSHDGMPNGCWRLSMDGPGESS